MPWCEFPDCKVRANFNFPTETLALYCSKHKEEGMINIISKRCAHTRCMKQPTFNFPTKKNVLYCVKHKKEGMVDIKSKRCTQIGCAKQPAFNYPNEKPGLYCNYHKKEGMINVISKRCLQCNTRPSFNFPTEKCSLYCEAHKKPGMVKTQIDKFCEKCESRALYGYDEPTHCRIHKAGDMTNLVYSKCVIENCHRTLTNITTKLCEVHRLPPLAPIEDDDFVAKRIKT